MAGRREQARRRLLELGLDLLADRAPWLSDQAYRAAATPLQWLDPGRAAEVAHERLDGVRERIAGMAAAGRASPTDLRRVRRDLARTRDDLARIGPRLPPVQAHALALRLTSYIRAVDPGAAAAGRSAPGEPGPRRATGPPDQRARLRGLRRRGRDAAILTGAAGAAWVGVLLPGAGVVAVEGGIVAAGVTAAGVTVARGRRARKERLAALARTLAGVDAATSVPGGAAAADLDRARRALVRRALASRRLDPRGAALLRTIGEHLDDLLVRVLDGEADPDVVHLVEATVTRYLPDTLAPFLALPPHATVAGRPAAVEVADQLATIERGLADARTRPSRSQPQTRLFLQGEFLRSKFGDGSPSSRA